MSRTRSLSVRAALALGTLAALVACGGDRSAPAGDSGGTGGTAPSTTAAPAPTGTVITVEMVTDETGNYFKPKDITAKPGDVLKFVLVSGVHNVHFVADSNPGAENLPPATAFAQLPQQALEVPVTMAAGKSYYFQCDPHAALGMVGHVKVEQ